MTIIGAKWAAILLDSPGDLIQGNTIGGRTAAGQENRYGIFMVAGNNTIGVALNNTIVGKRQRRQRDLGQQVGRRGHYGGRHWRQHR